MDDCSSTHKKQTVQQDVVVRQWLILRAYHTQAHSVLSLPISLMREQCKVYTKPYLTSCSEMLLYGQWQPPQSNADRRVQRERGLPAGPAEEAPFSHARSGCQTHGSASGSAAAPSPQQPANPPSGLQSAIRSPAFPCPAAGHYTAWLPAPGFSKATQITYRQAAV